MADSSRKYKIWEPLLLSVVTIVGMIAGSRFVEQDVATDPAISNARYSGRQVEEIIRFLETKYVGDVSSDELVEKAIRAIMEGLDPHTHYFPPDQSDELEEKTSGHYVGIGVEVMFIEDSLVVLYPKKDSPADKAGIRPGDYILAINDMPLPNDSLTESEVIAMIKGSKGTRIKLDIKPMLSDSVQTVEIIRQEIKVPSVLTAYMIDTAVAYIRLSRFTNTTYREFMDAWEYLSTRHQAKHLMLDLRDNPGGYLRESVNILSQIFAEEGKVLVYTEGKNKERTEYKSTGKVFFPIDQVAVLINENSASASEIIAGSLQDHDRAVIIGARSYGKGLVQEQYDLSNGGTLRLTVSRYYTPSGRLIQRAYSDDSTVDTSTVYKTLGGRPVYAGGGILPDVAVASSINWSQKEMGKWMDIISEFAIRYNLIHHNGELVGLDQMEAVRLSLPPDEELKKGLFALLLTRHPDQYSGLESYFLKQESQMINVVRSTLIAYRTGEEGWYRSYNQTDPVIRAARENLHAAVSQAQ